MRLLLHACCAPCSSAIIEWLMSGGIRPAIYYCNPNIFPLEEYLKRKNECTRYAESLGLDIIEDPYDHEEWLCRVKGLEDEPERGNRCLECFRMRLARAAEYAHRHGYDTIATTLASSRWKSLDQIEQAGVEACASYPDVSFWAKNWRKGGLQQRRNEIIKEMNFYNQTYCGCEFSFRPSFSPSSGVSSPSVPSSVSSPAASSCGLCEGGNPNLNPNSSKYMKTLTSTNFTLPEQEGVYHGKVRDVYNIAGKYLAMVATDRISAFDVVLPKGIPFKGQVLNQIAAHFLEATKDIVDNWLIAVPDPMVTVGTKCEPLKIEMIVRGYLAGSAWRDYAAGAREICGVPLPDGLKENQKLPEPILTPTTKADEGHDLNISHDEIVAQGIVSEDVLNQVEKYALALFRRGTEMAEKQGLILVDTKYEFGISDGKVILIDEIHTPDSSRYFYADTYQELFEKGEAQRQLSKEFVRQWLIANGFMGKAGQQVPEMTDEFCKEISDRYIELYERITGKKFEKDETANLADRVEHNTASCLRSLLAK